MKFFTDDTGLFGVNILAVASTNIFISVLIHF